MELARGLALSREKRPGICSEHLARGISSALGLKDLEGLGVAVAR
eukprot:CAMPEP_0113567100 /NCGR_PEP_ID=MMETSP0015_2-20120614/23089_1 /TAXON_ID=2838 /ORGANISM="Odontella" /LENGTH=44 /DNA_ID=CAMNT_0000469459 /DNA_START=60 /DNA_END=191 /DNA_ORIENTATION=+ /assembly_acc=CAM_ASM_000160